MTKKLPVRYLPPAEKDLNDLFDYIVRDAPSRAAPFLRKIDRSIARLARFPLSGVIPRDPHLQKKGYRILIVGDYLVFYRREKAGIVIDRILHGKRRYDFLF